MAAAAAAAAPIPIRLPLLSIFPKNQEPPNSPPSPLPQDRRARDRSSPMAKMLLLRSSDGKVLHAPSWDERPNAAQALPLETGVPSRALERVVQWWTKHALAAASGESREALAGWDADFARRLSQDGLSAEAAAAVAQLRHKGVRLGGCRPPVSSASRPRAGPPSDVVATKRGYRATAAPSDVGATAAPAAGAEPVRVWCRPPPVQHLRLNGDHHGGCRPAAASASHACAATRADVAAAARADLAAAWCATGADPASALHAAGSDPVRAWCAFHARVDPAILPDRAAASRAHGLQRPVEEEEFACHHRKLPMVSKACSSVGSSPGLRAPAAALVKKVPATVTAQLHPSKPAASSLRARRGLPELSCKCPQQNPLVAASRKLRAWAVSMPC